MRARGARPQKRPNQIGDYYTSATLSINSTPLSQRRLSSSLSEVEGTANVAGDAGRVLATSATLSHQQQSSSLSEVEGTVYEAGESGGVLASTSLSQR